MKQIRLSEVAAFLRLNDNYVILTHRRPDGDTIGCAAALCRALRQMGKTAHVLENPQFTEKYDSYLFGLTCGSLPANACILAVDIASEGLLPYGLPECVTELLIDHHGSNTGFALSGYVDSSAAACGEILLSLLCELGVTVDKAMAEAIYLAVTTDTGCFRFSNTTANTLRTAAYCMDCGADTYSINHAVFLTRSLARMKLEARLTETTEFHHEGLVAISAVPRALIEELSLTEDDIDDISGFGRRIAGVEISAMLREVEEGGKLSIRTSPNYDASAICARLGGGGHAAAAGATVAGGIEAARAAFLRVLREMEI